MTRPCQITFWQYVILVAIGLVYRFVFLFVSVVVFIHVMVPPEILVFSSSGISLICQQHSVMATVVPTGFFSLI
jgi:hypothetical protein